MSCRAQNTGFGVGNDILAAGLPVGVVDLENSHGCQSEAGNALRSGAGAG